MYRSLSSRSNAPRYLLPTCCDALYVVVLDNLKTRYVGAFLPKPAKIGLMGNR